jgi:hypothetical protein
MEPSAPLASSPVLNHLRLSGPLAALGPQALEALLLLLLLLLLVLGLVV